MALQEHTRQVLGGALPVDQVSWFAEDPSEAEQNGVRGKGSYNNPDESKVLGYPFILAAARKKIKAARGEDHSFSKIVM